MVATPLLLRQWLRPAGTIAASAFLALSPAVLYYSRFAREDIYIALWTVLLFIGVGFLLKYTIEQVYVPISVRLAGVAIGGIVLVLMGWLGVKAYGRAAERKGAAEAEQRQRAANAAARERMAAVPKPSADETVEIMRRGGM